MVPVLFALALCAPPADSIADLYRSGRTWGAFLASANAQRSAWLARADGAQADSAQVARAAAVSGRWRFLVIAEDWCRDSVESIPYLARLVELVPSLELRIVRSDEAAGLMRRYPTPDGRPATPTVVLLDSTFAERGCFVERPAALRRWIDGHRSRLDPGGLAAGERDWYRRDRGREVVRELVGMLEAAGAGGRRCPAG